MDNINYWAILSGVLHVESNKEVSKREQQIVWRHRSIIGLGVKDNILIMDGHFLTFPENMEFSNIKDG